MKDSLQLIKEPVSLAREPLADALISVADASIDAATGANLLDNVPVLGVLSKLCRATLEVREQFLLKKLAVFLSEASNTSEEGRERLRVELGGGESEEGLGARLLVLVERAEDVEKPRILGRLLAAYADGAFDLKDLWRLSRMVDRSHLEDLLYLKEKFYTGPQPLDSVVTVQCLAANGFIYQMGIDGGEWGAEQSNGGILYEISDLGLLLTKHGLEG